MVEPIAEPTPEPVGGFATEPAGEPAIAPTSESAMQHGRIVVGVDGSEPSLAALRWGARQAALTGANLEAVIAWEPPGAYGWVAMPGLPEDFDLQEPATRALDAAVEAALSPGEAEGITRTVVMGNPAQAVLDRAEGADLLVVGARGHGTFRAALLGSVSHTVTVHAPCPVVVVRGHTEQAD
jgi:nucleotide-binding universal stress UspA family protein